MYYKPETGEVFTTHSDIRSAMPNVIFENIITDEALAYSNVFPLEYTQPVVEAGKIAVPFTVEEIDGVWTQLFTVRDMTAEEIEASKPVVPAKVTRRQARQALLITTNAEGIPLLDLVAGAIAAIPDTTQRRLAEIAWEDATEFERYDALVLQIGAALGLDEEGLNNLFIFANTL